MRSVGQTHSGRHATQFPAAGCCVRAAEQVSDSSEARHRFDPGVPSPVQRPQARHRHRPAPPRPPGPPRPGPPPGGRPPQPWHPGPPAALHPKPRRPQPKRPSSPDKPPHDQRLPNLTAHDGKPPPRTRPFHNRRAAPPARLPRRRENPPGNCLTGTSRACQDANPAITGHASHSGTPSRRPTRRYRRARPAAPAAI